MNREPVDADAWMSARGPDLLRLAFALTGDAAGAQAVVVDALTRALPRWGRLARSDDPEQAMRRLMLAAHRRHARRLGRSPVGGTVADAWRGAGDERSRLREAARALPPAERAVLVLRCVEDLPLARVADLARAREGVVGDRLERGLAAVRRELGPGGPDEEVVAQRLRESLPPDDDELPAAHGLTAAARRALGERRRRRFVVAAAAAVALALPAGVVGALVAYDRGDAERRPAPPPTQPDPTQPNPTQPNPTQPDPSPPVPSGARLAPPVVGADGRPEGYRWETWHRLTIAVPDEWGYASERFCGPPGGGGRNAPPVIDRPGGASPRLGCGVASGSYGIQFADVNAYGNRQLAIEPGGRIQPGARYPYPPGSFVGDALEGDDAVRVVARSRVELRAILDSVRIVGQRDVHGCALRAGARVPPAGEGIAVCRYDGEGLLVQAERLDGSRALGLLAGLDAAPELDRSSCGAASSAARLDGRILLQYGSTRATVDLTGPACRHGVQVEGGERRALTSVVLYWVLSPGWSGPAGEAVTLPDPLRSRLDRPPAR